MLFEMVISDGHADVIVGFKRSSAKTLPNNLGKFFAAFYRILYGKL